MTITDLLTLRYGQGVDYLTLIQDKDITDHLPVGYLPKIINTGSVFLTPTGYVTSPQDGVSKVFYLYLNIRGELKNDPELSMVQMHRKYKGFLARIHVPTNSMNPESLILDYVIDLEKIQLTVDRGIQTANDQITESTMITFQSIDRSTYADTVKNWYEPLFDFDRQRQAIFEMLVG